MSSTSIQDGPVTILSMVVPGAHTNLAELVHKQLQDAHIIPGQGMQALEAIDTQEPEHGLRTYLEDWEIPPESIAHLLHLGSRGGRYFIRHHDMPEEVRAFLRTKDERRAQYIVSHQKRGRGRPRKVA